MNQDYFKKYTYLKFFVLMFVAFIILLSPTISALMESGTTSSKTYVVTIVCIPSQGIVNTETQFSYSVTEIMQGVSVEVPESEIESNTWDFGDGESSTSESSSHTYTSVGDYTVSLTINFDSGQEATESKTYSVIEFPEITSSSDGFSIQNGNDANIWADTNDVVTSVELFYTHSCSAGNQYLSVDMIEIENNNHWTYDLQTDFCSEAFTINYYLIAYDEPGNTISTSNYDIEVTAPPELETEYIVLPPSDDDDDNDDSGDDDDDDDNGLPGYQNTHNSVNTDPEEEIDSLPGTDQGSTGNNNDNSETESEDEEEETEEIIIQTSVVNKNKVEANECVKLTFQRSEGTGFRKVSFTPKQDLENVEFSLEKLKEKPTEIVDEATQLYDGEGEVYSYLDIKLTADGNYVSDELESMSFEFEVEKAWLKANEYDPKHVKFVRYHDGWQELEIDPDSIKEEGEYYYFTAETPGLSTFACYVI